LKNNSDKEKIDAIIIQLINEKNPQTVEKLMNLTKEKSQLSEQKILDAILKLQTEGKISFQTQPPKTPISFRAYLRTEQALWYWITIVTTILTTIIVFTIPENSYPLVYIRYGLGAIYVLWLPGYTFIKTLFPKRTTTNSEKDLDTIERIALSLGMSLALVPIIGLLLNYTPWGIRLTPIMLSLLTTTIFATIALVREYQLKLK